MKLSMAHGGKTATHPNAAKPAPAIRGTHVQGLVQTHKTSTGVGGGPKTKGRRY